LGVDSVHAPQFVLASASPRRRDLLTAAGFEFTVEPADVDETVRDGEPAEHYVRRLAEAKAMAVVGRVTLPVLAADTIVVVDGHILGKPRDASDAGRMLRRLSGRPHDVMTGVSLARPSYPQCDTYVATTAVEFAAMSDDEIDWYVRSGEPMDKAGAYAIQGLASRFVTRIAGSYSNVVGLPVSLVYGMCSKAGILLS
jgi:septum formation protein